MACDPDGVVFAPPSSLHSEHCIAAFFGGAAAEWVRKLAAGERVAGSTQGLIETARALDQLSGRG
jgi:hypothetical protein